MKSRTYRASDQPSSQASDQLATRSDGTCSAAVSEAFQVLVRKNVTRRTDRRGLRAMISAAAVVPAMATLVPRLNVGRPRRRTECAAAYNRASADRAVPRLAGRQAQHRAPSANAPLEIGTGGLLDLLGQTARVHVAPGSFRAGVCTSAPHRPREYAKAPIRRTPGMRGDCTRKITNVRSVVGCWRLMSGCQALPRVRPATSW
jgi:hypothetical protein